MKLHSQLLMACAFFLFAQPALYAQKSEGNNSATTHYLDCPCPHLIAHRGASGNYPESTQLAFEKALEFNTDILELDVHLSKDAKIVVTHDDSLFRITGKDLPVDSTPWSIIEKVNAAYSFQTETGEYPYRQHSLRVLTLNELIRHFPDERFNIEIKPDNTKLAEALGQFVKEHQLHKRVVVASKHAQALEHYRNFMTEHSMTSAHLYEIIQAYIYWIFRLDLDNQNYQLLQLPYKLVNQSLVHYLQKQGKKVHVWTVNEPEAIREMLANGVDGVMTDYPELAYPIFVEMGLR